MTTLPKKIGFKIGIKRTLPILLFVFTCLYYQAKGKAENQQENFYNPQFNLYTQPFIGGSEESITVPDSLKDQPEWNFQMGTIFISQNNYIAAAQHFKKAQELFVTKKNKRGQTRALHQLALVYLAMDDYVEAIGLLQQTSDKYKEMNDEEGMASLEIDMAHLLQKWKKYEAAEQHLARALDYFKDSQNTEQTNRIELEKALLQLSMNQIHEAKSTLKHLISNNDTHRDTPLYRISLLSLGKIYIVLNQPDTALSYLQDAIKLARKNNNTRLLSEAFLNCAKAYMAKGDWINADTAISGSYQLAKDINWKAGLMDNLMLLSVINTKAGKLNAAIDNLNTYIRLNEEVFSEEGNLLINKLMISHETEQIKKAYNDELKKNLQTGKELLKKQESKNITIIIGSFIVLASLIVAIFLIVRSRESRKGYALLAYKNKKISEQKEILSNLNLKLSQSREQYRSIVENAAIGIYQTTPDGKIRYANTALKKMLRFPDNIDLERINLNEKHDYRQEFIRDIEKKRVITGREDVWKRFDDTDLEVNESAWIICNNKNETLYYEGVVEDISDRKEIERAFTKSQENLKTINDELIKKNQLIEKSKNDAIRANEVKSLFLANVSHEIRTPMNSIIGFSEVLESRTDNKELLHYIKAIKSSGISLLTLLNDILDLSKIQAREIELHFEPVTITSIAHFLEEVFHVRIQQKKLQLKIYLSEKLPDTLLLDKNRLRQVLTNLIDNAIKFTDKGFVSISFHSKPISQNTIELIIEVEDSGIGIAPEEQNIIFDAFKQSRHIGNRSSGGTGLGLNITKQLIETMGGKITLTSQQGVGSIFRISFSEIMIANRNNYKALPTQSETQPTNDQFANKTENNHPHPSGFSTKLNQATQDGLRQALQDEWNKLHDSHLINDITHFTENLKRYSNSHQLSQVSEFAEELSEACSRFDIDKIEKLLNEIMPIFVINTVIPTSHE